MQSAHYSPPGAKDSSAASVIPTLLLLWLAGMALRLTILALPPVLQEVVADFDLKGWDIGVLTAIPSLLFALAALPGAVIINRYGALACLCAGLVLNAAGAAARGWTSDTTGLQFTTAVMCLGVAVMQPALSTLVRRWTPSRIGVASGTYTLGLLCGEVLPTLWTSAPDIFGTGESWRTLMILWSLPVLATLALIPVLRPRQNTDNPAEHNVISWRIRPDWKNGDVWKAGMLIGAVNACYFGLNGFLPGWLTQSGSPELVQKTLTALNASQIPAALILMLCLEKVVFSRWIYLLLGAMTLAAGVGLVCQSGSSVIILACVAGFSLAALLTLGLALPALLTKPQDVSMFSASTFTISYTISVISALLLGLLVSAGVSPVVSVIPVIVAAAACMSTGILLQRK